jgi:exopolysaccharide biosynthesis predicted pyruvyltransferase EpsI
MIYLPEALGMLMGETSFQYVPNRGNAGDALIAEATAQVCRNMGFNESPGVRTVLVAGGGGIHPAYSCLPNRLRRLPRDKRVIVLPSTVSDHWEILRSFDNLTLLARDEVTFGLAGMNGVNCMLVHDAAFSFDYGDMDGAGEGELVAMRTDGEGTGETLPPGNEDVSAADSGLWLLNGSTAAAMRFVRRIAEVREVRTNRLHVAIAAAMLGKDVTLCPGNYFKNRAVWEMSLRELGVKFSVDGEE